MDYEDKAKIGEWAPVLGAMIAIVVIVGSLLIPYIEEKMEKESVSYVVKVDAEIEKEIIGDFPNKTAKFSIWEGRNKENKIYNVSVFDKDGEIIGKVNIKYLPKRTGKGINKIKEERKMIRGNVTETLIRYIEIDSNTGEIIQIEEIKGDKMIVYPKKIASIMETDFYASWALRLKENAKWTEIIKIKDNISDQSKIIKTTYFVEGYEEVNGIKCFKVSVNSSETFTSGNVEKTQNSTKKLWIDAQKRILIKSETRTKDTYTIMSIQ